MGAPGVGRTRPCRPFPLESAALKGWWRVVKKARHNSASSWTKDGGSDILAIPGLGEVKRAPIQVWVLVPLCRAPISPRKGDA